MIGPPKPPLRTVTVVVVVALGEALPLSDLLSRQYDLGHQGGYPGSPPLPRA